MTRSRWLILLLVLTALLFFFMYPNFTTKLVPPSRFSRSVAQSITNPLLHQYKKGAHVYIGEVNVPNFCHTLNSEAIVRESYPEQVTIAVTIIPPSTPCPSDTSIVKKFKVAFQASKEATVEVTVDEVYVTWTATEASSNANLEAMQIE